MINQVITNIQNDLLGILDENQMNLLSEVLTKHLLPLQSATAESKNEKSDMLPVFIAAKRVEGCSEKSRVKRGLAETGVPSLWKRGRGLRSPSLFKLLYILLSHYAYTHVRALII